VILKIPQEGSLLTALQASTFYSLPQTHCCKLTPATASDVCFRHNGQKFDRLRSPWIDVILRNMLGKLEAWLRKFCFCHAYRPQKNCAGACNKVSEFLPWFGAGTYTCLEHCCRKLLCAIPIFISFVASFWCGQWMWYSATMSRLDYGNRLINSSSL
jgi:hypothetical protein